MQSASRKVIVGFAVLLALSPGPLGAQVRFHRDILPILSDKCFRCHGPDPAARQGDLRLDSEADAKRPRDGYAVIAPGNPAGSRLIERILATDEAERMPPPERGPGLTPEEQQLLVHWVREGARWERHWAFQPIRQPAVPLSAAAANPIDSFVHAGLAEEGLAAALPAEPAVLLRRVTLDLTGLPPSPEEKAAFLADPSPVRWRTAVERLLASPRFGECMAWEWLEAARYADTHGYQKDNVRTMWAWRDWVVRAFNDNRPFDQFTVDQIAGDLLPGATTDQQLATGFHRNHRINAEAGSIDEEFRVEYVADRVDTTATVWLGLTAGCARCHDHKFDPLTQRDYYGLFAFFNNLEENGNDGVGPAPVPLLQVPVAGHEAATASAGDELRRHTAALDRELALCEPAFQEWSRRMRAAVARGELGAILPGDQVHGSDPKTTFQVLPDGSVLVGGSNPLNDVQELVVTLFQPQRLATLRLEALRDDTLTNSSLARSFDGNFRLTGLDVELDGRPMPLARAEADFGEADHPVAGVLDGDALSGWSVDGGRRRENRTALFQLAEPVDAPAGSRLGIRLRYESREEQFIIGRFRLTVFPRPIRLAQGSVETLPLRLIEGLAHGGGDEGLREHFRESSPLLEAARGQRDLARQRLRRLEAESVTEVMVMRERSGEPRRTHLLKRGQYDQPGDEVSPAVLEKIGVPWSRAERLTRLDLARWLVHPDHPLTARVLVNRLWQKFFGAGLVRTPEDFGFQGDRPRHPELLDWLAREFIDSGWDVKHLVRLIVTSATYQQSARMSPEQRDRDLENRLLGRGPRGRLAAPVIRDQALYVSGLLDETLGGPPVKPYQPPGLWEAVAGVNSNTTQYREDTGRGLYRRSLYTFWKRSVPPPNLNLLDAASRDTCTVVGRTTNSPLQALVLLNDVTFVEAARALAARALRESPAPPAADAALRRLWDATQALPPTREQLDRLRQAYADGLRRYRADLAAAKLRISAGASPVADDLDPVMLAALTDVSSILLNLDSAIARE